MASRTQGHGPPDQHTPPAFAVNMLRTQPTFELVSSCGALLAFNKLQAMESQAAEDEQAREKAANEVGADTCCKVSAGPPS